MTSRERWLIDVHEGAMLGSSSRISAAGAAAHAANETGFGSSSLGKPPHHNLFGVKATGAWAGETVDLPTWEVVNGQRVDIVAKWRSYGSYQECFEDYADIIHRLYPHADHRHPVAFLRGLFLTGPRRWATDPYAFDKAARILGEHWELLDRQREASYATRVVLHRLSVRDVLNVIDAHIDGEPQAVLTGDFVGRIRHDEQGGRFDVRREEG